ncbi:MAG: CopG family transcriptional regulator [Coriobacteriia bacterium]|nr:CopG family transcriptional regulator [Coriobacteriia bacterium]
MSRKKLTAEELDKIFDDGEEDILPYLDLSTTRHPNLESKRVNIDFPVWVVEMLDNEAKRIGVTRQSIIKTWIAERLERIDDTAGSATP